MTRALVLMKAMPPTKGHERLINFATRFSSNGVVLMDTAPDEPLVQERRAWIAGQLAFTPWGIQWLEIDDQDPKSDGFWDRWKGYIDHLGKFDYVIGSEDYCAMVAEVIGARYIPYDPNRQLVHVRGTDVRNAPYSRFDDVADGFKPHMQTTITIFGAESTGKTTLSLDLHKYIDSEWIFEWARPYLENTGQTVVDLTAMHEIWHGQYAVEENAASSGKPFVIRDTDLYSTIGYWEQPHWEKELGPVPMGLLAQASLHKADLYIITSSNIPFEKDPLRYGGDHRESPDEYWISVAEKYDLNYIVYKETSRDARSVSAQTDALDAFYKKNLKLSGYSRELVTA